jgi:alpha 1,3-glucosidase
VQRSGDLKLRPFVLSRAFFAGSQRFGAIWTGDNKADWSHLKVAAPMLLSIGLGGLTFAGADVGGFFGNTDAELMVRWMQAGSYTPFFRGHAHHDAKRREPWMFGEPTTSLIKAAVMARYALLPYWYTLFYEASQTGAPTMRPLWFEYPKDVATFKMDDQWLVGSDLLVKPVTSPGVTATEVYLPGPEPWYDVDTLAPFVGPGPRTMATPLGKVCALQRGGSIVPRKLRLRRSASLMAHDPYTLYVALDSRLQATGDLYLDDETTHAHVDSQALSLRRFTWARDGVLRGAAPRGVPSNFRAENRCERVVVAGLPQAPRKVTLTSQGQAPRDLSFEYDVAKKVLTVRKPDFLVVEDFEMALLE